MQTKVIYLKGSKEDEQTIDEMFEQGFLLKTVAVCAGVVVGYFQKAKVYGTPPLEETRRLTAELNTVTESMRQKTPVNTPPKNKNR